MQNTYENYLKQPLTLTLDTMHSLHESMLSEIGQDTEALELYAELLEKAIVYAAMRAKWVHMDREEKMNQDSLRTSKHNSMITHFNMLARYLHMQGKEAKWRDVLGDENEDKYVRKTIGDFGCYLVFVNSICER